VAAKYSVSRTAIVKVSFVGMILLIIGLVILVGLLITKQQNDVTRANRIYDATFDDADQIKGYTCGVFDVKDAEQFLGTTVGQEFVNYTASHDREDSVTIRHYDSCSYESKTNSTIYAQFFIETYQDNKLAADNFKSHLPPVAKPEEKPDFIAADRTVYDAGVYYVLKGRQVVQVAASNGKPSQSEQFAGELLKKLAPAL